MSLDNSVVVPLIASGGYQIEQSLRFEDGDSPYLSWTPSSTGNRKKWTWSCWVKRSNKIGSYEWLFSANNTIKIAFNGNTVNMYHGSELVTNQVFRDPSAWYHLVWTCDTTQATASNRMKFYVNGEQVTSFSSENYPSQNADTDMANTVAHYIGQSGNSSYPEYNCGYKAEMHFIDGQQLDASYFGETGDYGEWKPIEYTGSYGTNGFYLDFGGTYYNDKSGNGNNFSATNLSTTDVVLDSPTNNFATLNPMWQNDYGTYKEGNLDYEGPFNHHTPSATSIPMKSGKWYMEFRAISGTKLSFGVLSNLIRYRKSGTTNYIPGEHTTQDYTGDACVWYYDRIEHNASIISYPFSSHVLASPNVYMIAFDADSGKVWFGKEGQWYNNNNASSTLDTSNPDVTMDIKEGDSFSFHATAETSRWKVNCGQDSSFSGSETAQNNQDDNGYGDFTYTPPSGFLALCTANLSTPAVIPKEHFNALLYTGDGTTGQEITGVGFQPDILWIKNRNGEANPILQDAVRGANVQSFVDNNSAEYTNGGWGHVNSFLSDGFEVDRGASGELNANNNGHSYISWNWKANGSGSSNTNGSITSTVSANQDAGISIVSYTGTGTDADTVGHGLSQPPEMIIAKTRNTAGSWPCYHSALGPSKYIYLDRTEDASAYTYAWNGTYPDSTVFELDGGSTNTNTSGTTMIAYCFHSVEGFSQIGSYTPNQNSNGPFIYTGFQPAWVLIKSSSRTQEWIIVDNERSNDYNPQDRSIKADDPYAESTGNDIDFLSNGFKIRTSGSGVNYASGDNMIYMAFAEVPLKYANAR